MDSSQLIQYNKDHAEYNFYEFGSRKMPQDQQDIRAGAGSLILNHHILIESVGLGVTSVDPPCIVRDSILKAFEKFLQWIVANGLGPTLTARALYVWFMATTTPFHWIQHISKLSGVHDNWNWDKQVQMETANFTQDEFVWMNHAIVDTLSSAFKNYDVSFLLEDERQLFKWKPEEQLIHREQVRFRGNWTEFWNTWKVWINYRNNDGYSVNTQPTQVECPNMNIQLQTDSVTLPEFVDSTKWTPLKLPMKPKKQTYLGFYWDSVPSTGVTEQQEQNIDTLANTYMVYGADRLNEVKSVIDITGSFNDTQKVIAEFWAGGPGTVTPPGMMGWFWKEYVRTQAPSSYNTLFSGLDLGIHLFEGSRITWRQKSRFVQARPIQEVRVNFKGQTFTSWNGQTVQAELWTPYQEVDFVTPPFADFPSGHSHFSQTFANVMTQWFGTDIPVKTYKKTDLYFLSPVFKDVQEETGSLGDIVFPAQKSLIQPGIVPETAQKLEFTVWQDIADSAGMSRLYGGIHCLSAHTSSQAIANQLHKDILQVWPIDRK